VRMYKQHEAVPGYPEPAEDQISIYAVYVCVYLVYMQYMCACIWYICSICVRVSGLCLFMDIRPEGEGLNTGPSPSGITSSL
jgi:hypothetical protein